MLKFSEKYAFCIPNVDPRIPAEIIPAAIDHGARCEATIMISAIVGADAAIKIGIFLDLVFFVIKAKTARETTCVNWNAANMTGHIHILIPSAV